MDTYCNLKQGIPAAWDHYTVELLPEVPQSVTSL